MARTPENAVKKKVKELLARYPGIYGNWPVPGGYGASMLDFVGCYRGWFFAIETKFEDKLTPRQEFIAGQMREAGGLVFVINGLNEEDNPDSWQGWAKLANWLECVQDGEYDGEAASHDTR